MTDVTVRQFADVVGLPVDRLLAQLGEAGLSISGADDTISDKEKAQLLSYLRKSHGKSEALSVSQPKRVTLKRKSGRCGATWKRRSSLQVEACNILSRPPRISPTSITPRRCVRSETNCSRPAIRLPVRCSSSLLWRTLISWWKLRRLQSSMHRAFG